jgi:hypothetical protein
MNDELDWRLQVRRGSDRHDAALEVAVVVFEDCDGRDE